MRGLLSAIYSACAYAFFLGVFVYAIFFVKGVVVPKTIDSGAVGDVGSSVLIDALLLGLFAIQHSLMARPAFKRVWTKVVPEEAERSTFVLFASVALGLLFWQWRPLPQTVWLVDSAPAAALIAGLSWFGWGLVLLSTFLISHFHLFGVTQGFTRLFGLKPTEPQFVTPAFYRWLRHPIYAGFIIAFWATPHMTLGHLFFAFATTAYIFIGIWLEERDLVAQFGDRYRAYRENVGMLWPRMRRGPTRQTRT